MACGVGPGRTRRAYGARRRDPRAGTYDGRPRDGADRSSQAGSRRDRGRGHRGGRGRHRGARRAGGAAQDAVPPVGRRLDAGDASAPAGLAQECRAACRGGARLAARSLGRHLHAPQPGDAGPLGPGPTGRIASGVAGIVDRFPQAAFARGWLCLSEVERDRREDGQRWLRSLVDALPELPRNGIWPSALAVASVAAAALEDVDAAATVHQGLPAPLRGPSHRPLNAPPGRVPRVGLVVHRVGGDGDDQVG